MREISREPQTHEFLIKALREASGELINELESVREREACRHIDGEWCLADICTHVRDFEQTQLDYVERILSRRTPALNAVNFEALIEELQPSYRDLNRAVYEYARLREQLVYLLWSLNSKQWQRAGVHVYRGQIELLQLIRELHLHDLEHLWHVRALRQQLAGTARA